MAYVNRKSYKRKSSSARYGSGRTSYSRAKYTRSKTRAKKAARTSLARKATPRTNRSLALRNKRTASAALKLARSNKQKLLGPHQSKTGISPPMYPIASQPLCLHLNNLNVGDANNTDQQHNVRGPNWMQAAMMADGDDISHPNSLGYETVQTSLMGNSNEKQTPMCNGPSAKWNGTELQFKVEGFLDDTRVHFYVVQQKQHYRADPWHTENRFDSDPHYLPYTINEWQDLIGFNANRVNLSKYKILAHKSLYFNSRKTNPDTVFGNLAEFIAGTDNDDQEVDATTKAVQYCTIKLTPRQMLYQIKSTEEENGLVDSAYSNEHSAQDSRLDHGPYSFENQHPNKNTWLIICTDDQSAVEDWGGDSVRVTVIRRNWWQDKRRPTPFGD